LSSLASPKLFKEKGLDILYANSLGLKEALEFSEKVKARLIFSSTSEVYGNSAALPFKEGDWGSVNPRGERSCYDESKRFNTYGPGMHPDDGRVIINFLKSALLGQSLKIYGDGHQTRSFCYISDTVAALVRYAESGLTEPVNIGTDTEISVLDLAKAVQKTIQSESASIEFTLAMPDDPRNRRPDISLALEKLAPWKPQVSLTEGIRRTYQWMVEQSL
jgi:nucleoside-diphosphate-sugar epimerase